MDLMMKVTLLLFSVLAVPSISSKKILNASRRPEPVQLDYDPFSGPYAFRNKIGLGQVQGAGSSVLDVKLPSHGQVPAGASDRGRRAAAEDVKLPSHGQVPAGASDRGRRDAADEDYAIAYDDYVDYDDLDRERRGMPEEFDDDEYDDDDDEYDDDDDDYDDDDDEYDDESNEEYDDDDEDNEAERERRGMTNMETDYDEDDDDVNDEYDDDVYDDGDDEYDDEYDDDNDDDPVRDQRDTSDLKLGSSSDLDENVDSKDEHYAGDYELPLTPPLLKTATINGVPDRDSAESRTALKADSDSAEKQVDAEFITALEETLLKWKKSRLMELLQPSPKAPAAKAPAVKVPITKGSAGTTSKATTPSTTSAGAVPSSTTAGRRQKKKKNKKKHRHHKGHTTHRSGSRRPTTTSKPQKSSTTSTTSKPSTASTTSKPSTTSTTVSPSSTSTSRSKTSTTTKTSLGSTTTPSTSTSTTPRSTTSADECLFPAALPRYSVYASLLGKRLREVSSGHMAKPYTFEEVTVLDKDHNVAEALEVEFNKTVHITQIVVPSYMMVSDPQAVRSNVADFQLQTYRDGQWVWRANQDGITDVYSIVPMSHNRQFVSFTPPMTVTKFRFYPQDWSGADKPSVQLRLVGC